MNYLPLWIVNPDDTLPFSKALLIAVVGIAVVMVELILITLIIQLLSKILQKFVGKEKAAVPAAAAPNAPAGVPLPEGLSQGSLKLTNVDEPTAAVIMAIVSDKSGIPLNRLNFKSISLQEDK